MRARSATRARSTSAKRSRFALSSRFALAFNFPPPSPLYAGHAGYNELCSNEKSILFQACNGRKSNYFCDESSYVSVLVVLLAILCLSALPQALLYSFYCCVLMFRVCGNQHNKFIDKKVGREISGN